MRKIIINPPPRDRKCECCGKHIKDVKPFGKAGDPLVGDFNGALLVKTFRTMAPDIPIPKERKKRINTRTIRNVGATFFYSGSFLGM